jgi:hypothetical protein
MGGINKYKQPEEEYKIWHISDVYNLQSENVRKWRLKKRAVNGRFMFTLLISTSGFLIFS